MPQVEGKEVYTVEGLPKEYVEPIARAFADVGAVQCGFCTPGFINTANALLKRNPKPTPEEVRKYIEGNLCRCTGYKKIIEAILKASEYIQQK